MFNWKLLKKQSLAFSVAPKAKRLTFLNLDLGNFYISQEFED